MEDDDHTYVLQKHEKNNIFDLDSSIRSNYSNKKSING